MPEMTITCPNCSHEIPLTESIAAPLIEENRKQFREQLAAKDAEFQAKDEALQKQQVELTKARASLEEQVQARLQSERAEIAKAEAKKAKEALSGELERNAAQLKQLQEEREKDGVKLAAAQAEFMRKERELSVSERTALSAAR